MTKIICMFWHKFYVFEQIYNCHQLFYQSILSHLFFIIILYILFDFASLINQELSYKKLPDMLNKLFFVFPTKLFLLNLY